MVTNHKLHEREVMPQYFKLEKKVRAGAQFVINQLGWNARKDDELLRWVRGSASCRCKMIANVYLLTRGVARVFHAGRIPGCVVSDELLAQAEKYGGGEDKGREFFVDLAAKQVAVARGLGYQRRLHRWAHADRDLRRDPRPGRRRSASGGARWPRICITTGPASSTSTGAIRRRVCLTVVSARSIWRARRKRRTDLKVPARYRVSRVMHNAVFAQDAPLFPLGTKVYEKLEDSPKSRAARGASGGAGREGADVRLQGLR